MLSVEKSVSQVKPYVPFAIALAMVGTSVAGAAVNYTVTNISTKVAGVSTNDYGSTSLSSDGSQVAGLTTAKNPFLYVAGTGASTVLTSVTATTVAVNNSGTLVSGNTSATTPNAIYQGGITTTVATSAISNQNATGAGANFVSFTGINNAGVTSGNIQYNVSGGGSPRNEGVAYSIPSGTGQDVGSSFSDQLATQIRGNILYSVNDSGVGAGFGPANGTTTPQVAYIATPNGTGGYGYTNLGLKLAPLATSSFGVLPTYVGIDSHGDVAGTFTVPGTDGFLYDASGTAYKIEASGSLSGYATNINGLAYVNGVATVVGVASARRVDDVAVVYTESAGYQTLASYIGASATGYTLYSGLSISDNGSILASGKDPTGVAGLFLFAAPAVPEPTSMAVLGLGCVAAMRRTRRSSLALA